VVTAPTIEFTVLEGRLCIAKLPPGSDTPVIEGGQFVSITSTADEVSIICDERLVPSGAVVEPGWRAIKVKGPLGFGLNGVLASLLVPLAEAEISVLSVSTYDTDYVLVVESDIERAVRVLVAAGHRLAGEAKA
jgi:uncharacterized protein